MNRSFRKVHRKIAPILFLPLLLSAVTGIVYRLGFSWFQMPPRWGGVLLSIHQGGYLGAPLRSIYVLLLGLGLLGLGVTGLTMLQRWRDRPRSLTAQGSARRFHRVLAPLIVLPLIVSALSGVILRLSQSWFGVSGEPIRILLALHQGSYLGPILHPFYVLLVGAGLLFMLLSGINLTGIVHRRRSSST